MAAVEKHLALDISNVELRLDWFSELMGRENKGNSSTYYPFNVDI